MDLFIYLYGNKAGRILRNAGIFYSSPPLPDLLWGPSSVLSCGYWGSFPDVKAAVA
jgi:hypothetical protein